ncbi:hypothetical protein Bca52824_039667 [Brassica carinata]|uniref:Uncharacterized protein n=1 Tax=Brassica carinata TaxID=52824 RepID=A0A8X7RTG1_BRACI|nr:hypothetical protein Bca52824_039667 [Brassica carinata]
MSLLINLPCSVAIKLCFVCVSYLCSERCNNIDSSNKGLSSVLFLNLKDVNFVLCEGDVVIVEDDDKNAAGKGRNLQVLRDIGNVVRRNHPKNNDPAKRALMCTTR